MRVEGISISWPEIWATKYQDYPIREREWVLKPYTVVTIVGTPAELKMFKDIEIRFAEYTNDMSFIEARLTEKLVNRLEATITLEDKEKVIKQLREALDNKRLESDDTCQ